MNDPQKNDLHTNRQVGWVKADTKAIQAIHDHVITHNPRVSVSHSDHSTWYLHIKNVQEEDRGQYMCQINTDPMKSQVRSTFCVSGRNKARRNGRQFGPKRIMADVITFLTLKFTNPIRRIAVNGGDFL